MDDTLRHEMGNWVAMLLCTAGESERRACSDITDTDELFAL